MPKLPGGDRRADRPVSCTAHQPVGPPARPCNHPAQHDDDLAASVMDAADGLPHLCTYAAGARFEEYIRRVVDAAPPLTAAQRERLALLLLPEAATRPDVKSQRRRLR